ncbi:hypothetical protein BR93DRAFT_944718 [Coniochaeta sp. PMI_546]|nr:hypothetical protein BR93DRAFT_944718 [Coniochaeta sp. PMI_546]
MVISVRGNGHLGLLPRCGICADIVFRHERVIALFGNRDSTSYLGHTRPFAFPEGVHTTTRVDGRLLCRDHDCIRCAASPEFAPIHFDCFEIFRQQCSVNISDALDRLWILAAWRNPWRGAYPIHFSVPAGNSARLRTISSFSGLPRLSILPSELLEMIRQYSRHSLLWRCVPVLELADYISAITYQPLLKILLPELLFWERGRNFELVKGSRSTPSTLRLTIDSAGISKLERLPRPPVYSGEYTSRVAFIVQDEASVSRIMAHLKDGQLRLEIPTGSEALPIWNTPAPPSLTLCRAFPGHLTGCHLIHTVEMSKISGITFLFGQGRLFGIHIHRSEESCAMETFARRSLYDRFWGGIVWIYLPISRYDPVLVLGFREGRYTRHQHVLVRTELIGDVIVGLQTTGHVKDRSLVASAPVTMVYGEPLEGRSIRFDALSSQSSKPGCPPLPFRLEDPGPCPLEYAYFSWAPLRDVASTLAFYDRDSGFCRGIVLHYENGGCRAVGQCRLQVDPAESVARPVRLYFQATSYTLPWTPMIYKVRVKFKQDVRDKCIDKDVEGWESQPMQGMVRFWFTGASSFMDVVQNDGAQT